MPVDRPPETAPDQPSAPVARPAAAQPPAPVVSVADTGAARRGDPADAGTHRAEGIRSVVVVGAGLAGAATVTALRDQGFTGRVTVLGAEGTEPYDRPPLSKELLSRTEPAWLRDEIGADLGAADDVRLHEPATGLSLPGPAAPTGTVAPEPADAPGLPHAPDRTSFTVRTTAGVLTADAVVLATGSVPVRPPGWEAALTLHTAADAARLRALLTPGRRLVVVGAGWIGAEVAGVAAAAGVEVTVVEATASPLAPALGTAVGALTVPWYAAAAVRLVTGARVQRVATDGVELSDGEVLAADVVLAAVGARPASRWLAGTLPLGPDGSLDVDEGYRVLGAPPGVVAVGDLARRRSTRHGWVPGGHWDGALRGPAVAVRHLLGGAPTPADDHAPYVFSTQLGHDLALYGRPGLHDDVVLRGDPSAGFTALWFTPGTDELTAALAVDRPRDVAAARRLFTAPALPMLDGGVAADADRPLRDALR